MPKKAKKRTRKNNRKAGDNKSMHKFAIGDMVMWRVNRVHGNPPITFDGGIMIMTGEIISLEGIGDRGPQYGVNWSGYFSDTNPDHGIRRTSSPQVDPFDAVHERFNVAEDEQGLRTWHSFFDHRQYQPGQVQFATGMRILPNGANTNQGLMDERDLLHITDVGTNPGAAGKAKKGKTAKKGKKGSRKAGSDQYEYKVGDKVMWRPDLQPPTIMYGVIVSRRRDNKGALYNITREFHGGPQMQRRRSRRLGATRTSNEAILQRRFDREASERGLVNAKVRRDFYQGELREKHLLLASDTGEGSGRLAGAPGDSTPSPIFSSFSVTPPPTQQRSPPPIVPARPRDTSIRFSSNPRTVISYLDHIGPTIPHDNKLQDAFRKRNVHKIIENVVRETDIEPHTQRMIDFVNTEFREIRGDDSDPLRVDSSHVWNGEANAFFTYVLVITFAWMIKFVKDENFTTLKRKLLSGVSGDEDARDELVNSVETFLEEIVIQPDDDLWVIDDQNELMQRLWDDPYIVLTIAQFIVDGPTSGSSSRSAAGKKKGAKKGKKSVKKGKKNARKTRKK